MPEKGVEEVDGGEAPVSNTDAELTIRDAIRERLRRSPSMRRFVRLAANHGLFADRADSESITGLTRARLLVARAMWLGQPLPPPDDLIAHGEQGDTPTGAEGVPLRTPEP